LTADPDPGLKLNTDPGTGSRIRIIPVLNPNQAKNIFNCSYFWDFTAALLGC